MRRSERIGNAGVVLTAVVVALLLAGCGDDDGGAAATSSPTVGLPSATPTVAPTATPDVSASAVRGLLVVHDQVNAGVGDSLAAAPESLSLGGGFSRTLSFADYSVECDGLTDEVSGTTDGSGQFAIDSLPPGDCTLIVSKTLGGNLMTFSAPFTVGDDGAATVTAEVAWGRVRVTSEYSLGGDQLRKVSTDQRSHIIVRGGLLREISYFGRVLVDDDGDGSFESPGCDGRVWQCPDFGECGEGRNCSCTASCPFCDDCGPPVCVASFPAIPYQCDEGGGCANPNDECVCASSSADTQDCPQTVCIPACGAVEIEEIRVNGQQSLVVGQEASFNAAVVLSDGFFIDVTGLADWLSSDPSVLTVGAWGLAEAIASGDAELTASLADVSGATAVTVTPRPALESIILQNFDCYGGPNGPFLGGPVTGPVPELAIDEAFAPPLCVDAIEIGSVIQYQALGQFAGGYYEDVTSEVSWSATPSSVGTIVAGLFTGAAEGTASISASLDGISSDTRDVRVVTERSVVAINIYPDSYFYFDFPVVADILPCFDFICAGVLTVLVDDEVHFHATARFDIGGWEDVTDTVEWSVDENGVVSFGDGGLLTAVGEGQVAVVATLGEVESHPYGVRVVADATLQSLDIYQEGANAGDRVIEVGGDALFRAQGFYDVGFARDSTQDVQWRTSDESVARFDEPGVLTGLAAGSVAVWAQLDGVRSRELLMEVFAQTDIDYCDVEKVNRGTWTDGFNRVYLESDCADYAQPAVVQIRFTVTETERPAGIFDPCLDLYAFRVDGVLETPVRTIREEGCGEPFLAAGAPEFDDAQLRYQLQAFWDLKDGAGNAVAPGTYRIKGRFYLYYDPVVTIDIEVE